MVSNPADKRKWERKRRSLRGADNDIQALAFNKTVRKGSCASFASGRNAEKISCRYRINFIIDGIFCFTAQNICNIRVVNNTAWDNPSRGWISMNIVYQINGKFVVICIVYRQAGL